VRTMAVSGVPCAVWKGKGRMESRTLGSSSLIAQENHRMVGVGRDLCGSPSPTPCQSRVTQSRLHRTLFRRVLNISREGDSTASLGSLGQGSVTLRGKKFFLMFRWNFLEREWTQGLRCCISGTR